MLSQRGQEAHLLRVSHLPLSTVFCTLNSAFEQPCGQALSSHVQMRGPGSRPRHT